MSDFLDELTDNVYAAIRTLESERYYEFSGALVELLHHAKHYQRISESLLSTSIGVEYNANEAEFNRAHSERDWYRHPETPVRPCAEIEE
jgi:hypothetical protein